MSKRKIVGLVLLLFFFLCVLFLPAIASTSWGTKQLIAYVERNDGYRLRIGSMRLSWFSRQSIKNLYYESPHLNINFSTFKTDSSLLTLLLTKRIANTWLEAPRVSIDMAKSKKAGPLLIPFQGNIDIKEGSLKLERKGVTKAQFKDITVRLELDDDTLPITLVANGQTIADGQSGSFTVDAHITRDASSSQFSQWISSHFKIPHKQNLSYNVSADFINFPLLQEVHPMIRAAIGSSLTAHGKMVASSKDNTFVLSARSKHVDLNIRAIAPADTFVVETGSYAHVQITPQTWEALSKKNTTLGQPFTSDIRINKLQIPFDHPRNTNGALSAQITNVLIIDPAISDPITIANAKLDLKTADLLQDLAIRLDMHMSYQKIDGTLQGQTVWATPFEGLPTPFALLTHLDIQGRNLPTALAGKKWMRALGPSLNLGLQTDNQQLTVIASSKLLNAPSLTFKVTPEDLTLVQSNRINYTLYSPFLNDVAPLSIHLSDAHVRRAWKSSSFKAQIACTKTQLSNQMILNSTALTVNADSMQSAHFALHTQVEARNQPFFDPLIDVQSKGKGNLLDQTLDSFTLSATDRNASLTTSGTLSQTQLTTDRVQLNFLLSPKLWKRYDDKYTLMQKVPASLQIEPLIFDRASLTLISPMDATLFAKELNLSLHGERSFMVHDLTVITNLKTYAAKGQIDSGSFQLAVAPDSTSIQAKNLPSRVIDPNFAQILGPTLSLDLEIDPQNIDINLDSRQLKMKGSFEVQDNLLLSQGLTIQYLITQIPNSPLLVKQPAYVDIDVDALSLPIQRIPTLNQPTPQIQWNIKHILFDGTLHLDQLTLKPPKQKIESTIKNLKAQIKRSQQSDPLQFTLDAELSTQKNTTSTARTGHIDLSGTIDEFQSFTGKINGTIDQLPTLFLDLILPYHASLILGSTVSGTFKTDMTNYNGNLNLTIDSPHLKTQLDGYVSGGNLHLQEPLKASLALTPALSEVFFTDARLLVLSAKKPVTLYIDSNRTSIPLKNFKWQNLQLGASRLDFGKIIVASKGAAADLIEIFKLRRGSQVSLWFAPMNFTVRHGVLHMGRTEILYDMAYQVALWGQINFPHRYVNMKLGLTAQSLNKALSLRLPAKYVLPVNISGPFKNVQVDKGAAIAKIALLIADQTGLAPQSGIAGGVFGIIQGLANDQSNIPPPNPPFPWQQEAFKGLSSD